MQIGNKRSKTLLYADDMIIYRENHKDSKKAKLFELMNNFSEVSEYRINIQKSVMFLYRTFAIVSKKYKYLGINLVKEMKGLYSKNCNKKII